MPILGIWASSFRSAAGPVGAYDALATITVPSGGAANITFTGIPAGYKHLQLRGIAQDNRTTYNQSSFGFRFNGDSGNNYSYHFLQASWGAGATGADSMGSGTQNQAFSVGSITSSVATNTFGSFVIDILDYANVNKNKTIRGFSGADADSAAGYRPIPRLGSGAWYSTSAITSMTIYSEFGTAFNQYSQFALYGVK
jgi:hypothetical protein